MTSERVDSKVLHEQKWIRFQMITYKDPEGKTRYWECVERTTRQCEVDAVAIFATLRKQGSVDHTLLVSQYRPPLDKKTIELPAGLIDKGETPLQAALRELKEETGYVADESDVEETPVMYMDPGITNANMKLLIVKVDLDRKENKTPTPATHLGEFIETFVVPIEGLYTTLKDMESTKGCALDSRLASMAFGMSFGR